MSAQPMNAWLPISSAPRDTIGVAVVARMLCCGGGKGRVVMVAGRQDGKWIYPNEHHFEFTHWSPLPRLPEEA